MKTVIARLPIKEGKMDEALAACKDLAAGSATEEGVLLYTINAATTGGNALVFVERYRDKAALEAHAVSPHMRAFMKVSAGFLAARPELTVYDEIHSAR